MSLALLLVEKTGRAQNGLEPELQCVQWLEPGVQLGCDQGADRLELAFGRRPTKSAAGEGAQALVNGFRVQVARHQITVESIMSGRWPLFNVWTLHLDFPHSEFGPSVGLKHTMPPFETTGIRFPHFGIRFEFRKFISLVK